MKVKVINESKTVKAKDLKPGMRTSQGIIKSIERNYYHGKRGVEVNYSTNGHAEFDWFEDDKDVVITEMKNDAVKSELLDEDISMSLLDAFMKYHEDPDNYENNTDGFDKMYDILSKYGTENEPVDKVFIRAPENDQKRMIELIKPDDRKSITISELSDKFYKLQRKDERGTTSSYEDGYLSGVSDCLEAFGLELK